ncbi:MAG: hypothetical protein LBG11_10310 [Bifidobacteriaceae bacterium]|nr:hypothetical protein [Bifidobacteriaceae bacterium]
MTDLIVVMGGEPVGDITGTGNRLRLRYLAGAPDHPSFVPLSLIAAASAPDLAVLSSPIPARLIDAAAAWCREATKNSLAHSQ